MTPRPTLDQRAGMLLCLSFLRDLGEGRLILSLPDGSSLEFGDRSSAPVSVRIDDYRFFRRVLLSGGAGLAESYAAAEWDSDNLTGALLLLSANASRLRRWKLLPGEAAGWTRKGTALLSRPARFGSPPRKGEPGSLYTPEILSTFLDSSLSLSAARFADPAMTLEQARAGTVSRLLAKARLRPEHHLLEIGCGLGGIAIEAARLSGCRVTSLTSSRDRQRLASERARQAGVAGQVEVRVGTLRELKGRFDRVLSLERVAGEEDPSAARLLAACDRLLTPRGIAVLRFLAVPRAFRSRARRGGEWSRKRGFPGGALPPADSILRAIEESGNLVLEGWENLGPHASRTLAEWRLRLFANREKALALGWSEVTLREWAWFLSWAEAGLTARLAIDAEVLVSRPGNPDLPLPPRRQF